MQDYREANTRYLLQHDNWTHLIIDASKESIDAVTREPLYYRHALRSVCAFIDRDNINTLLRENGITGDIGLLSIDIDGNDYWIWEAIECISPRIVICEYDSLLGPTGKSQRHTIRRLTGSPHTIHFSTAGPRLPHISTILHGAKAMRSSDPTAPETMRSSCGRMFAEHFLP